MRLAKPSSAKPLLSYALSVALPTEEQTWLLRACLWSGARGRRAWEVWKQHIDDPTSFLKQDKEGVKGLLPLLFAATRNNNVAIDKKFQTYLRTAYLREELRSKLYRQICRNILSVFANAGISAIILKGAALAETVYGDPALQHSHYLDILVRNEDLLLIANLLPSLGFGPLEGAYESEWQRIEIQHDSGLPLLLHRRLFPIPFYDVAIADLWTRSQIRPVVDFPSRQLSPADNLLHVCGSAFCSEPHESLRWVCDSWFLIDRCPELNWDVLLNSARRNRLALTLSVTLGYMKDHLQAPIPETMLKNLHSAAAQADTIGREVSLLTVRSASRGGFRNLIRRTSDWLERIFIIKWIFFPSPSYLRWVQNIKHEWQLPFYYVYRPLSYIGRRMGSACNNHLRGMGRSRMSVRGWKLQASSLEAKSEEFKGLFPKDARLERVATGFRFIEGPVWIAEEKSLLFSDIPANQILRLTAKVRVVPFRDPSGNSNGLTRDREGRLIACEHSNRRLTRTQKDGRITILADHFEGKKLNSPNDVVVKSDGAIYFTDPSYGIKPNEEEQPVEGVYRLSPDQKKLILVAGDFEKPNGLAFSPDERKLYIDDSDRRHIRVFDVQDDGSLANGRIFHDMEAGIPGSPDGMKVDVEGHVYCTGAGGVWVFNPKGKHLGTILTPEKPSNCAWGDDDWRTLYITAGTSVYKMRVSTPGIKVPRTNL